MKTSVIYSHGKLVDGKFPKTCKGCQIDFLARARNQRYCGKECPGTKQRFVDAARNSKLRAYGLSKEDYDNMLEKQGGVCAICKNPELRTRHNKPIRLAVDHDHSTGKVRGLLCTDCNRGLGMFHDDPSRLISAAAYVEKPCD